MKNLFLALLAMVAIVACNNNDGLEFGFDITIGPSGEYSVSGARTVSADEFANKVIGAGWVRKAFHHINKNQLFKYFYWCVQKRRASKDSPKL